MIVNSFYTVKEALWSNRTDAQRTVLCVAVGLLAIASATFFIHAGCKVDPYASAYKELFASKDLLCKVFIPIGAVFVGYIIWSLLSRRSMKDEWGVRSDYEIFNYLWGERTTAQRVALIAFLVIASYFAVQTALKVSPYIDILKMSSWSVLGVTVSFSLILLLCLACWFSASKREDSLVDAGRIRWPRATQIAPLPGKTYPGVPCRCASAEEHERRLQVDKRLLDLGFSFVEEPAPKIIPIQHQEIYPFASRTDALDVSGDVATG